ENRTSLTLKALNLKQFRSLRKVVVAYNILKSYLHRRIYNIYSQYIIQLTTLKLTYIEETILIQHILDLKA
ncbi:hypothetical protein CC78DRAFT_480507, partial [Lojkania enalia]